MAESQPTSLAPQTVSDVPAVKRRWRNFLINKRMQLKYTLLVALIAAAVGIGLGSLAYRYSRDQTQGLGTQLANDQGIDPELARDLMDLARQEDMHLALGIGVGVMLLVVAVFLAGIVVTHRFAGPGYRMTRIMDEIGKGKLATSGALRKGDELQEVFDALNRMVDGLRRMQSEDLTAVEQALKTARENGAASSTASQLDALSQRMRKRLSA